MRVTGWSMWLKCLVFVLVWSLLGAAVASANEPSALGGTGSSSLESPLVVPEVNQLLGGQPAQAVEEVRRASPEAVVVREESETKYEGLNGGEAEQLDDRTFPGLIDRAAGGLPMLPSGESVSGFPSVYAAQVDLGQGRHGVIDSLVPIAVETSPDHRTPLDLGLHEVDGAFEPVSPLLAVRISKQLSGGVALAESGVSLTPVDRQGSLLGGEKGVVDGSSILFTNTQADEDTVVKPSTFGFDTATILRSVSSPSQMFYRIGLPQGAILVQRNESGAVQVIKNGAVIATIVTPVVEDAEGASVPVSMMVSGDILTVTAKISAGEFDYPIEVDPEVIDESRSINPGVWAFYTNDPSVFEGQYSSFKEKVGEHETQGSGPTDYDASPESTYYKGDYGYFSYNTQGASRIYAFIASIREVQQSFSLLDELSLRTSSGVTESGNGEGGRAELRFNSTFKEWSGLTVCSGSTCGPQTVSGSEHNSAYFEQKAQNESHSSFSMMLTGSKVEIEQEKAPTASFDTADSTIEGQPNALLSGKWYKSTSGLAVGIDAYDQGIGVYKQGLSSPAKSGWGFTLKNESRDECQGVQCNECYESPCTGKASGNGKPLTYSLASAGGELPEGEDTVEGKVEDATGLNATAVGKIKIDNTPPSITAFNGLPSNHELIDGQHVVLKASAKSGPAGIASITLDLDGQQLGGPQGGCSGSCTGNAEWTLSGENYAAGEHALTVFAEDTAGNVEKAEYHVVIHHPQDVAVGPGAVNPVTGELNLSATDVSVSVPDGALTVGRSYRSRHLEQVTEGPLGPQWDLALGAEQSLYRVSGGMVLAGGGGAEVTFASKGGGEFTSPTGDAGLVLSEKNKEGKTYFTLSDNGSVTTFELPTGSSGSVWMPSSSEGPNGTSTTLYKFKAEGGVIEPTEELAPVPSGVSCGKEISELKEGCRALKFEYATETKAKGENASEWGEFKGHLSKVKYIAWNASKTKTEPVIAEYAYDKKGRLRAEWNPQVTPSLLKTTYGYDTEGHITAVNSPGHEPWLLEQGTIPSDASTGRLLAVSVPSAGTALGTGEAPVSTETPTLSSTTPKVGVKISVSSNGKWNASPLAFVYQWQDCNSSGQECTAIPGAVNQAYYPVSGDEGHTLVAQVVALNATGSTTASSAATSTVATGTPNTPLPEPPSVGSSSVWTLEYQVPVSGASAPHEMISTEVAKWGQTDVPNEAIAIFPPDKVMGWPAKKYERETVYYLDGKDRAVNTANPAGGISTTEYNSYNDVVRALSPDNRKKALEETGKTAEASKLLDTESSYEETGSEPGTKLLSTLGPQHTVKLTIGKEGKAGEEVLARDHMSYFYNEGAPSEGGPYHLVTKTIDGAETASKEEFDKRTTETSYSGQEGLGWKLRKPTLITTDPTGLKLAHRTMYDKVTGNTIEASQPMLLNYMSQFGSNGTEGGHMGEPRDIALDGSGNIWVLDTDNHRVQEFNHEGTFVSMFGFGVLDGKEELEVCTSGCRAGIAGSGNGQLNEAKGMAIDSKGNIWVSDQANNCVQEFNKEGKFVLKVTTANGKAFSGPQGLATDSKNDVWIADRPNDRIVELNESGGYVTQFGRGGTGNGEFKEPIDVAVDPNNNVFVLDTGNSRVQKFNSKLEYVTQFGSFGTGNGQFKEPKGLAVDQAGNVWVADSFNARLEEFTSYGEYLGQYGSTGTGGGQFKEPRGIAVNSAGIMWVTDVTNNRVEQFQQATAHNTKTIYYSAPANSEYKECGEHAQWANLPCQTLPATQPGTSGLPELPVTKYAYNIWDEPETTTETVASTTRTKTDTYDGAGRLKTEAISSTVGTALPTITNEYNSATGALEKQSTTTEGKTKTITSVYNKLGQLESYTDASENTSTYEYDIDGRVKKINDGKGTETYTYSETTGLATELAYENGTTKLPFTGTYDVEGNMLTESYPNGMTATYTYNQVGKPTALEYKKTTHCTEKCVWFSDSVIPSIHGQWFEQASTFSHQTYTYDSAGRLTQVQNTPAGKGCTTRIYAYDKDTNRTSFTTREPAAEGKCATEGGKVQEHTYDTADRLTDTGTAYNTFGDITTLPAKDAEESAEHQLTNTYYTNNQVASQKQNEQTVGYNPDPAGRTLETVSSGKPNNSTIISHYAGPGNAPAWTVNPISGEWRRNITGISGTLVAIQNNGETPELQLTNLHGDIIAKAYLSETATELAAKADTSEFGVPLVTAPAKYAWLGASELPTELPSGVVTMGARSYVPQIGRFLQPDPIPGGSANAYAYTFGDPVNTNDPTGAYTNTASATVLREMQLEGEGIAASGLANHQREEREQREAFERRAAAEAARAAAEATAEAVAAAGPQYAGEAEEWEEWWEEEGEYEYVADHNGGTSDKEEAHVEPAILVQPLSGGEDEQNAGQLLEVKGGPGICQGHCKRAHQIWSHAGGSGGPTVGQVFGWGKEAFGLADCAYELATLKGACPRP